jgi:hypothetical protein
MTRYWVRWEEPLDESEDYRPRVWPLPAAIVKYWCSGYCGDMSAATLCAIVDAPSRGDVEALILAAWGPPSTRTWSFCEEREGGWMPPPDRFPL